MHLVYFIYGLSFVAVGLIVSVRYDYESNLDFDRILWLLAVFGFVHGFREWMDLWRLVYGNGPVQAAARPAVLLLSYLFLFEFGRRLARMTLFPPGSWGARLLGYWIYFPLLSGVLAGTLVGPAETAMDLWSRWLFGFPGALLAGAGLMGYARRLTPVLGRSVARQVKIAFHVAGSAFVAYGGLGGLIGPGASWFPASVINQNVFFATFHMPVQLWRAACAVVIAVAVRGLLRVFHLEGRKQLHDSEERFRRLFENAPVALAASDRNGRVVLMNRECVTMFGYSTEEIATVEDWRRLAIPEIDRDRYRQDWETEWTQSADGVSPGRPHEQTVTCKDGSLKTVLQKRMHIGDRIVVATTDITDLKLAETEIRSLNQTLEQRVETRTLELRAALALNENILSASPDAIFVYDENGSCILANPVGVRLIGANTEKEALLARNCRSLAEWPDDTLRLAAERALKQGQNSTVEAQGDALFGRPVWLEANFRPFRASGAQYLLFIAHDITDVRQKEEELRLAAAVFHNSSEGVLVTDADGIILSVNSAFTEITGFTAGEALGNNPRILRSDHHDAEFYRKMWETLLDGGRWQGEIWNRRKDGEAYLQWMTIDRIDGPDGRPTRYVSVFHDITEMRRKDRKIAHLAFHDALTGLPNRMLFKERLSRAVARQKRGGGFLAIVFFDLDRFKTVNDTLGHDVGDLLLQEVAGRMKGRFREVDTVARMGGDEFVVLMENLTDPVTCTDSIAKAITDIAQPMTLREHPVKVGASAGVAFYPDDGADVTELMKCADLAMYAAKAAGRNTWRRFKRDMLIAR